jgi:NAD(P)-dependent dehydrogenase (short-subunit alcohol dehydrogenase family)
MDSTRFSGRTALITGGTNGFGRATAELLLAGGARVLVTGRTATSLEETRATLGERAAVVRSDAASLSDTVALADRARAELGALDLLFVNAGITRSASLAETDEAVYDEVFATNTKGAYFTVQALAPLIVDGGAVVMSTSVANVKGLPLTSVYAASKAALRSMARTFARELLPRGSASTRSAPAPSTPASSNGRFLRTSSSGVARRWWPTTRWLDSDAMRRSRELSRSWPSTPPTRPAPSCRWTAASRSCSDNR